MDFSPYLQESEVKTLARDNFHQGAFERLVNQVAVHDQATTPPPEGPLTLSPPLKELARQLVEALREARRKAATKP